MVNIVNRAALQASRPLWTIEAKTIDLEGKDGGAPRGRVRPIGGEGGETEGKDPLLQRHWTSPAFPSISRVKSETTPSQRP